MGFDSAVMRASVIELDHALRGARINRIHQPDRLTLVLRCHGHQGALRVLISAGAQEARVHLTTDAPENPAEPPMFCMLLRKRLENGRIIQVFQDGLERTASFHVESIDELGDLHDYFLTVETMGRHSNILLIDPGDRSVPTVPASPFARQTPVGTVVDAIKRVTPDMSRVRPILPGVTYEAPPAFDRPALPDLDYAGFQAGIEARANQPAWRSVLQSAIGVSPVVATEFLLRCDSDPERPLQPDKSTLACLHEQLAQFRADLENARFVLDAMFNAQGAPLDFAACSLEATAQKKDATIRRFATARELLDTVYGRRRRSQQLESLRNAVIDPVRNALRALRTREQHQLDALERAAGREQYRVYGELLTANLYQLEKNSGEVVVTNWYDPEQGSVTIPLDPALTPNENAQRYFRMYNKLKRTEQRAGAELRRIREQLDYLESVEYAAESAEDQATLEELRDELRREGLLKSRRERSRRTDQVAQPYHTFRSSDGHTIYAGKNNRGNDLLTLRLAHPDDYWFHVKELAGAHVVVRVHSGAEALELPEETLHEAAQLAAYFSKGRHSTNVPVDYTLVRHVRKPRGAKPGMVIYDHHRTLWATPDADVVERLRSAD